MKTASLLLCAVVFFGSMHAEGHEIAAKWFRFVAMQKYSWSKSNKGSFRFIELALRDADGVQQGVGLQAVDPSTDPADMPSGTCLISTPYTTTAANVKYAFDGTTSGGQQIIVTELPTQDKEPYCLMSVTNSATWTTVVAHLPDSANPISSYLLYVGNQNWYPGAEHDLARWKLEASHDGITWFTVHDQSKSDATRPAAVNSPYNGGVAYRLSPHVLPVVSAGAADSYYDGIYVDDALVEKTSVGTVTATSGVRVCRLAVSEGSFVAEPLMGEALAMAGIVTVSSNGQFTAADDVAVEQLVNRGTVSVANGASLVASPGLGETAFYNGGGISGPGGVRKTGDGVLEMDGTNTYAGPTVVESGILRIGWTAARPAKWFRIALKEKYSVPSDASILDIGEFALYDAEGVQQNIGPNIVDVSVADRQMGPGTLKIDSPYPYAGISYLCDGLTDDEKRLSVTGLPVSPSTGYCTMSGSDPSTWITMTVRLSDDAAVIAGYNLYLAKYNYEGTMRSPKRWTVEASLDGVEWFTVDDRTYVTSPGGNKRWYNGGVAFPVAVSRQSPESALPSGSALYVAPGALAVSTNGAARLSRLCVDCLAGAGEVNGFAFAPDGALYLGNSSAVDVGYEVPITLSNVTGGEHLRSWTVYYGVSFSHKMRVRLVDGKLVLRGGGFILTFR